MKSIETSGKTVEEAVQMGLKELKLDSSDVAIDVLDAGSPGLFGMFGRLAKVRLTVKEEDRSIKFDMPVFSLSEQSPKESKPEKKRASQQKTEKRAEAEVKPKPSRVEAEEKPKPARAEAPEREDHAEPKTEKRARRAPEKPGELIMASREDLPERSVDSFSDIEKQAYDFLLNLTRLMGVNVEIRVKMDESRLQMQMIGDTYGILIGRRGETLDSLQYLTSLIVNKGRDEYIRVSLDTEYYRARREEALYKLAARMASRVKKTRSRVVLEPMNPYERRVLHAALQNDPYVTTHSEGEDPYRRVVITLK